MSNSFESPQAPAADALPPSHGMLPPWNVGELPAPPPFTVRNALHVIGPGAILLAGSIGGGEWIVGPKIAVEAGYQILWIATTAIVLQLIFNLEGLRYALYTGEPALTGIMRLKPSATLWAVLYIALAIAQLGVPALAASSADVILAAIMSRDLTPEDAGWLMLTKYAVIALGVGILISGKKIERTLEWASWIMVSFIFTFLVFVNVYFVPLDHWLKTGSGFFTFGYLPEKPDIVLLAALAATAGSGGIGNLVVSNWARDKGYGMGKTVGAIGGAFDGETVQLSHIGRVFVVGPESLARWRNWGRYVAIDQVALWAGGCFLGMYLNVNLATYIAPADGKFAGGAGVFQAHYMAEKLWHGFWFLALMNGFWIFFSTHLGNTDGLVRVVTDTLWTASGRARKIRGGASKLYFALLLLLTGWGCIVVNFGTAMELFQVLAALACPVMTIAAIQLLIVNTTFLPPALRPAMWRRVGLVLCALFYGVMSSAVIYNVVPKLYGFVRKWLE